MRSRSDQKIMIGAINAAQHRSSAVQARGPTVPRAGTTTGDPMMNVFSRTAATAAAFSLILGGSAFAQTTTPAPAAKTAPDKMAPAKPKAERTAASLECSKQADAKGLHGKERKKFRSECKKGAVKAN
jgi:hypothetical protein